MYVSWRVRGSQLCLCETLGCVQLHYSFKGTVSRDGYFFEGLNILNSTFCVCALSYTIINFLFASLKLLTNFENAYCNPPFLLWDWSMFSSADLSLAAGTMRENELVTGGFGIILLNHRRLPVSIFSLKIAA